MSFTAENNVIRVTDTNGAVVFDTGTPMPHIAAVITNTITHTFPESSDSAVGVKFEPVSAFTSGCRSYQCNFEYVCDTNNVCGFQNVCDWVDVEGYRTIAANKVGALEHSQVYDIGSVSGGTNPDFLLVLMTANRTTAGGQADFGTFISAVPTGQKIAANGSTVLESAFILGGTPWLSRIVSVYLSGNTVKAEFKHSNREYTSQLALTSSESCLGYPSPSANADNTSSTWVISFEVYVGKFTQ